VTEQLDTIADMIGFGVLALVLLGAVAAVAGWISHAIDRGERLAYRRKITVSRSGIASTSMEKVLKRKEH